MRYNKPRTINAFSILLVMAVGIGAYLLIYLWPVYSTSSHAKSILYDHVPALYKANLRPDEIAHPMIETIKEDIAAELKKIGINDKATKIIIQRSPKEISLEAHFKLSARFPFPDKAYEFNMSPKVTSDATRIDW
jgi:hypothetical protein